MSFTTSTRRNNAELSLRPIGFDAASNAIDIARDASSKGKDTKIVDFLHLSVEADWPEGEFGVVSMIDVIHHIDPKEQRKAIEQAVSRVAPGGLFLFKDIGVKPHWRAWANRLHDLVLARQWIHYVSSDDLVAWVRKAGLEEQHRETINMFWYGHELFVFRRPQQTANTATR